MVLVGDAIEAAKQTDCPMADDLTYNRRGVCDGCERTDEHVTEFDSQALCERCVDERTESELFSGVRRLADEAALAAAAPDREKLVAYIEKVRDTVNGEFPISLESSEARAHAEVFRSIVQSAYEDLLVSARTLRAETAAATTEIDAGFIMDMAEAEIGHEIGRCDDCRWDDRVLTPRGDKRLCKRCIERCENCGTDTYLVGGRLCEWCDEQAVASVQPYTAAMRRMQ